MTETSRRAFLKAGAMAAGAAALWPATSSAAAARQRASRQAAPPNILFLFSDQHRYDWTSANRSLPIRMPNLERVAAEGVRFARAYCASPLCGPSRACLAAGREYDRARVPHHGIPYPADQPTFYGALRAHGYHVMGCGKFDLDKGAGSWGIDGKVGLDRWGFSDGINSAGKWDAMYDGPPRDPYNAYLEAEGLREVHRADMMRRRDDPRLDPRSFGHYRATHPTALPERAYSDNYVARNGLSLLRAAPEGRPWFLQVNFPGPHEPMDVTHRMYTAMEARSGRYPAPHRSTQLTPDHHAAIRRNYTGMIENVDRWIGIYLDELERRGQLENTIVVYSADHGEMLGDHDRWAKSVPYEPSVGVPLVVAGPGVRRGHRSEALVSVIDLAATFLDAAGAPAPDGMDARSLVPLLAGETDTHREVLRSGLYGWRAVSDGRYKLVRGFAPGGPQRNDGTPAFDDAPAMLFDLEADPHEDHDLASRMPERVRRMTEALLPA